MAIVPGTNHSPPARRFIVLGASNVALSFPALVATAHRLWAEPLDILGAFGHGRSYGQRHALFWRELPGIAECGLWPALAQRPPVSSVALVTDVGNDLLYDVPVPEITAWVQTCLDRLRRAGARIVLTPLPLANIARLSRARFLFFRTLFFPGCRLSYATLQERAHELDRRLRALAKEQGALLGEHRPEWYGLDPIHIRRPWRSAAWSTILSLASQAAPLASANAPLPRLRLRRLRPERRWMFGREQRAAQPVARLPDGTHIGLY